MVAWEITFITMKSADAFSVRFQDSTLSLLGKRSHPSLDQFAAAKAAKQMLAALAHIHGVGYIHCDVKPDVRLSQLRIYALPEYL